MAIKIREFKKDDKNEVLNMFNEFGEYFVKIDVLKQCVVRKGYAQHFYKEMLKNVTKENGKIYVSYDENTGKLVGFIAGNIFKITEKNSVESVPFKGGRVLEFFVREEYRGKRVGTLLMNKMLEYFKSKKCDNVNVEVFSPNKNAYSFYKKSGFFERNVDLIKIL